MLLSYYFVLVHAAEACALQQHVDWITTAAPSGRYDIPLVSVRMALCHICFFLTAATHMCIAACP
jgi:hypothetical protein